MRRVLSLLTVLCAALCQATFVVRIPANGAEPMPNYFSGTNCRASVHVHASPVRLQIVIGGLVAYDQTREFDPDTGIPANWNVYLMFDSTRFADGSMITVQASMWDGTGAMTTVTSSEVRVKNKAVAFNQPSLIAESGTDGDGALGAKTAIDTVGTITVDRDSTSLWSPWTWFIHLMGCNIAFVAAHGDQAHHRSGDDTYVFPYDKTIAGITYPGYLERRTSHIGTGIPPFNSTSLPPLNLLNIHSCNCFDTWDFQTGLWPYSNAFGGWTEDQAATGFTCFMLIRDVKPQAQFFLQQLANGQSIFSARYVTGLNASVLGFEVKDVSPGPIRFFTSGDQIILGDFAMRLTTVYSGFSGSPIGWVREVSPW